MSGSCELDGVLGYLERMAVFHLERAEDLEGFANRPFRLSRYAWLAAAKVHRNAAAELTLVSQRILASGAA